MVAVNEFLQQQQKQSIASSYQITEKQFDFFALSTWFNVVFNHWGCSHEEKREI
jgi:hypothetical protein